MALTTTTSLPAPIQQTFMDRLLSVPTPDMIHNIPAMRKLMPVGGGRIARFRRYNPLTIDLVPLGNEGINPPSTDISAVDIDAQMEFYGQYLLVNEQVN